MLILVLEINLDNSLILFKSSLLIYYKKDEINYPQITLIVLTRDTILIMK